MFEVNDVKLWTSKYSQTDWTQNCVGVGSVCDCHRVVGDSVTRDFVLGFTNTEFVGLLATLKG